MASTNQNRPGTWLDISALVLFVVVAIAGITSIYFNNSNGLVYTQFAITLVGLAVSCVQVKPDLFKITKEKILLILRTISILLLIVVVFLQIYQLLTPRSTPIYVTPSPSSPAYAHISIAVLSSKPSDSHQETHIALGFKNTGTSTCTGIAFSNVNLINLSGNPIKPSSPINHPWTLPASDMPIQRNVTFPLALAKGAQYNLAIHLDVGGCAVPPNQSSNRFADYLLTVPG